MLKQNAISTALEEKGLAFGSWTQMNCPEICEIQAKSGLDFVIIDMEHGSFGIESAVNMIRAVEAGGSAPIVRLPDHTPGSILKVLDAGAVGIIAPGIETREQMEQVVSAARYAPTGTRGACPCVRATGHGVYDWAKCTEWAKDNILVFGIVETLAGIENYSEIVSVPGLNAIAVGQFDLSQALGYAGNHTHPDVISKQAELAKLARESGTEVLAVIFDSSPEVIASETRRWTDLGARIIAVSGDRFMLASGYQGIAKAIGGLQTTAEKARRIAA